jgi:hypothetical protein
MVLGEDMKNSKVLANQKIIRRYQIRSWYLLVILIFICAAAIVFATKPKVISPCPEDGCAVQVRYASDDEKDLTKVIAQTAKEFEPEGSAVVHEALNIMWCEHRFNIGDNRDKAHLNDNGSYDWGTFQINTVWEKVYGTDFHTDYKANIHVAHLIWLRSHSFKMWVCEGLI